MKTNSEFKNQVLLFFHKPIPTVNSVSFEVPNRSVGSKSKLYGKYTTKWDSTLKMYPSSSYISVIQTVYCTLYTVQYTIFSQKYFSGHYIIPNNWKLRLKLPTIINLIFFKFYVKILLVF